jgi:DNA repair protein SbcD/Mre11
MLKVLHTADWHLGQSFFGFDRDYEHSQFLDWLLLELRSQQPDVLLIAGDVFDTINPSATAQRRYYNFLANAHSACPKLQIVIVSGNHDAGARLEAPSELLESLNISVVGTVRRFENGDIDYEKFLVPLKADDGTVQAIAIAVPFLRPSDVPLLPVAQDPYLDGIRELYRRATQAARERRDQLCPGGALIAMGHCHLQGAAESPDSERRLVIGGAESLEDNAFDEDLAYVALGHLHRAQDFSNGRVRYSGSPIPLSFAEIRYAHQVLSLTFDGSKLTSVTSVPVRRTASLVTLPSFGSARVQDVLDQIHAWPAQPELPTEEFPFLEVRVLEDGPDPTRRQQIEEALDGKPLRLASIKVERRAQIVTAVGDDDQSERRPESIDLKSMSPEDVFLSAFQEKYGTTADDSLVRAFREVMLQEGHSS